MVSKVIEAVIYSRHKFTQYVSKIVRNWDREVTLAENWLKSTDSPLFIFAKPLDSKGIAECIHK
jgi:hypothetical protein